MTVTRHASSFGIPTNSNTNYTVPIPSGAVAGDIAVITISTKASSISTVAANSGWTKITTPGNPVVYGIVSFWKLLVTADLGTNVSITGNGYANVYVSVEVWGGVQNPTSVFLTSTSTNPYTLPSATAPTGSVPLYVWVGYDSISVLAPTNMTPPSGWTGSFSHAAPYLDMGIWFTNPLATANAPGGTLTPVSGTAGAPALMATIILPPSTTQNAYLIGANAGADTLCTVILAGATAAQDTTLIWTP